MAAHPLQTPQDQVGLPERWEETVMKEGAQTKGPAFEGPVKVN